MSTSPGSTLEAMALTSLGPEDPTIRSDRRSCRCPCCRSCPSCRSRRRAAVAEGAPRGAGSPEGVRAARGAGTRGQARAARGRAEGLRAAPVVRRCVADAEAGAEDGQGGGSGEQAVADAVVAGAACPPRAAGAVHTGAPGSVGGGAPKDDAGAPPEHRVAGQGAHGVGPLGRGRAGRRGGRRGPRPSGGCRVAGAAEAAALTRGGVTAGSGIAAWLVVSGVPVGAVSGWGRSPAPRFVWSFWSSVMSAVLRLSSGGPGSPRSPLDTSGLYARSEKVMTRINVVCADRTAAETRRQPGGREL